MHRITDYEPRRITRLPRCQRFLPEKCQSPTIQQIYRRRPGPRLQHQRSLVPLASSQLPSRAIRLAHAVHLVVLGNRNELSLGRLGRRGVPVFVPVKHLAHRTDYGWEVLGLQDVPEKGG